MFEKLGKKLQDLVVVTLCFGVIFLMTVGIALTLGLATPKNTTIGREILGYMFTAPTPEFVPATELCPDNGQPSFVEDYNRFYEETGDYEAYPPVKDNTKRVRARFGDMWSVMGAVQYHSCEFFRILGIEANGDYVYLTYFYRWNGEMWEYIAEYCEYGCGPKEPTPTPPVTSTKDANG